MTQYARYFLAGVFLILALPGIALANDDTTTLELDKAEASLQAYLVENPDLPLPRLALARVYFLQGKDTLAREHFERVLASDPPPQVVANINRHLQVIRARRKWSGNIGFAIAPDTNIEGASTTRTIKTPCIGPLILICGEDGYAEGTITDPPPTSGTGIRVWGGAEYQHPLGDRTRLRFGGDIARTEYQGNQFDTMTLSGHLGPRWLINPRTETSLLFVARRNWKGNNKPEYRDLGLRLEGVHRVSNRTRLTFRASRLNRQYDDTSNLDGPIKDISLGVSHVLAPTLRGSLQLGWSREKPARSITSRNTSKRVSIGLSALLPKGYTIGGDLGIAWKDYEGKSLLVLDGGERKDTTKHISLRLHRRDFTIMGFSPEISIRQENRTSTAQRGDYKRTSGAISFVRPL